MYPTLEQRKDRERDVARKLRRQQMCDEANLLFRAEIHVQSQCAVRYKHRMMLGQIPILCRSHLHYVKAPPKAAFLLSTNIASSSSLKITHSCGFKSTLTLSRTRLNLLRTLLASSSAASPSRLQRMMSSEILAVKPLMRS